MAYELGTMYRMAAPNTEDDFARVWPTFRSGGALAASSATATTGPLVGCMWMSSRWESLDEMAGWWGEMAQRMQPGGDLADVAAKSSLVTRVLATDVAEAGQCDGAYVAVFRATATAWDQQAFEMAAKHHLDAGCNGARAMVLTVGGEWTGQYVAQLFTDSLDALMAGQAITRSDSEWLASAEGVSWQTQSVSYFQVISRM